MRSEHNCYQGGSGEKIRASLFSVSGGQEMCGRSGYILKRRWGVRQVWA